jgi:hypothetical protein
MTMLSNAGALGEIRQKSISAATKIVGDLRERCLSPPSSRHFTNSRVGWQRWLPCRRRARREASCSPTARQLAIFVLER